jgi:hypothetical protein
MHTNGQRKAAPQPWSTGPRGRRRGQAGGCSRMAAGAIPGRRPAGTRTKRTSKARATLHPYRARESQRGVRQRHGRASRRKQKPPGAWSSKRPGAGCRNNVQGLRRPFLRCCPRVRIRWMSRAAGGGKRATRTRRRGCHNRRRPTAPPAYPPLRAAGDCSSALRRRQARRSRKAPGGRLQRGRAAGGEFRPGAAAARPPEVSSPDLGLGRVLADVRVAGYFLYGCHTPGVRARGGRGAAASPRQTPPQRGPPRAFALALPLSSPARASRPGPRPSGAAHRTSGPRGRSAGAPTRGSRREG